MRVPVRQRVLHGEATAAGRQAAEQRGRSPLEGGRADSDTAAARLSAVACTWTWAAGPIFGSRSAHSSRSWRWWRLCRAAAGAADDRPGAAARACPEGSPRRSGRTAALAVDLRTGTVVYSRNEASRSCPPRPRSSPVAYTALAVLGPAYRFQTELMGIGEQVGSVWRGNLVLRGHGDPTLEPADLDALAGDLRPSASGA